MQNPITEDRKACCFILPDGYRSTYDAGDPESRREALEFACELWAHRQRKAREAARAQDERRAYRERLAAQGAVEDAVRWMEAA